MNYTRHSLAHLQDPWASQIKARFSYETSHEKILNGNYAIIGKTVHGAYFPENKVNSADIRVIKIFDVFSWFILLIDQNGYCYQDYRLMEQPTASFHTTFVVQPWLINPVNKVNKQQIWKKIYQLARTLIEQNYIYTFSITKKVIMLLRESGIMAYHLSDVIYRRSTTALREVLVEYDTKFVGPKILTLTPLATSFSVLILGLFISTIVFVLELKSFTGPNKSFRQVLLGIKKNREVWNVREGKMIEVFGRKELKGRRVLFLRP